MSKLQLLAQKRNLEAAKKSTNEPESAGTILMTNSSSNTTGLSKLMLKRQQISASKEQPPQYTNALSSLLTKKKALNARPSPNPIPVVDLDKTVDVINESPKVINSSIVKNHSNDTKDSKFDIKSLNTISKLKSFTKIQSTPTHILPEIMFGDNIHQELLSSSSSPFPKRRKIEFEVDQSGQHMDTNKSSFIEISDSLAQKISKNFNDPSPDDKRKVVESLSEKVSQVNLEKNKEENNITKKKAVSATKPKSKINIQQELERKASKPLLSLIVIGHVDSGKSTTIGRLLYDLGIVDSRTLHKLTRDAEIAGKGSFSLAWVMDQTPEERSRGVTIDIVQTQFETSNMKFAVIDSPGHRDYVPQMINGVTQADVAVVIIDATSDLIFEASNVVINDSISSDSSPTEIARGQTFEQLTIARNLGIERVLVVINKMDAIGWDQDRFESIKNTLQDFLIEKLDFSLKNLDFLPASGFKGDNIVKKSENCPWNKNGDTLFEYLEKMNEELHSTSKDLTSDANDPFALTVTDITSATGVESISSKKSDQIIIHGRVNSGILQPGETVKIWPCDETGQVDSVITTIAQISDEARKNNISSNPTVRLNEKIAVAGEFVELKLRRVDLPEAISLGDIVTKIETGLENEINVTCSDKLTCEIRMFGLTRPVLVGTPFVLFRGNVSYSARLASIEWVETKIVNEDGTIKLKKNKKKKHLSSGQRGKVIIETEKEIPIVELNKDNESKNQNGLNGLAKLRRVVLRKEGMTVGAGKIISSQ